MTPMVDPVAVLRTMEPGVMVYARFQAGEDEPMETGLFIREDMEHIEALPRNPVIEVRSGLLKESSVWLIPVMVKAGEEVYETWLNYYQRDPAAGKVPLHDWAEQATLALILFGPKGRERSIRISNPLADLAQKALSILGDAEPWTMEDFDAARAKVYRRRPTVADMWDAMGG